jgi:hypothetical protein
MHDPKGRPEDHPNDDSRRDQGRDGDSNRERRDDKWIKNTTDYLKPPRPKDDK